MQISQFVRFLGTKQFAKVSGGRAGGPLSNDLQLTWTCLESPLEASKKMRSDNFFSSQTNSWQLLSFPSP